MSRRAWLFVLAAGVALAALGQLDALGPVAAASVTVLSSVGLALLAHGGVPLATEAAAMGASGALAYEAARPVMPLAASGLLLVFVFGTRAMRARSWRELAFHLGAAFVSGVAASWVAEAHQGQELGLWMVAITVASLLASIPWLLPADAARGFALRRLASRARGPLRVRLLRAVVAHGRLADVELSRPVQRRVDRAFDQLARRVERDLERELRPSPSCVAVVDQLLRVARAAALRDRLLQRLDDDDESLASERDALEAEVAGLSELA